MAEMRTESGVSDGCTIHYNMDQLTYARMPGINASALKGKGRYSPKHLRAYLTGQMEWTDSEDMKFGRAAHCLILEPERFDQDFPVASRCGAILTSGDRKGEQCTNQGVKRNTVGNWFCGTHGKTLPDGPQDFVSEDELARLHRMRESLKTCEANAYLRRSSFNECVIQWQQLGMTMKTRIDKLSVDGDLITVVDFKKCQVGSAHFEAAQKACLNMRYDVQAWFQVAGCLAAFGADKQIDINFMFIEDKDPFDTYLLPVDNTTDLEIADRFVIRKLKDYVNCKKTGKYHGCQIAIDPAKRGILPSWYVSQQFREGT